MTEPTKEGQRYWTCCIGPVDDSKIPDGGDSPPRKAAEEAIEKMTGEPVEHNWSGWGDTVPPHEVIEKLRSAVERASKTLPGATYLREALEASEVR